MSSELDNGGMATEPEPGSIESNHAHMAARAAREYKAHMEAAESASDPKHYLGLAVRALQKILRYGDEEGRELAAKELRGHQVAALQRQAEEVLYEAAELRLIGPGPGGENIVDIGPAVARRLFKKLPDKERWDKLPEEVSLG